jgi:hypothetical protein
MKLINKSYVQNAQLLHVKTDGKYFYCWALNVEEHQLPKPRQCSNTVELGYDVMKGTEYCVSLPASVDITDYCNVMANSEELIGTTEYLAL